MLLTCTGLHLQQALLYQKHKKHCFKTIIQVCARNKQTTGNAEAKTTWMSLKTQQSHPTTTHKRYQPFRERVAMGRIATASALSLWAAAGYPVDGS